MNEKAIGFSIAVAIVAITATVHIWGVIIAFFTSQPGFLNTAISVFLAIDLPFVSWGYWIVRRWGEHGYDAFAIASTVAAILAAVKFALRLIVRD